MPRGSDVIVLNLHGKRRLDLNMAFEKKLISSLSYRDLDEMIETTLRSVR